MEWRFNNDRAIYSQIIEQIQLFIVSGKLMPGEKLASVRELAAEAEVNPNTMQKALSELEQTGLVFSNRTSGRFVTDNAEIIAKVKKLIAKEKTEEFLNKMKAIGYTDGEILDIIKSIERGIGNE